MLYRGLNRAELDAAYDNRRAVPNVPAIKADWLERGERIRRAHPAHLDIIYGAAARERLDLFLADDPNGPTLAFIHGGYWQLAESDKENYTFLAEGLLSNGINLAMIEYTLAPEARMDRIVAEVARSIGWLAEHLGEYGADPRRIYVSGHSAGGHLTATAMTHPAAKGGLAISGIYDLEPIRLNYLNEKLGLDEAEVRRNSPILNFPPMAGPLIVAYGTKELPELCRQSVDYAQVWVERGLPGHLLPVDGTDHFTVLEALADPKGGLAIAVIELSKRA